MNGKIYVYGLLGPFVASNWAVGTFMLISLGTWYVFRGAGMRAIAEHIQCVRRTICRKSLEDERRKVQRVVEAMPKRMVKKSEDTTAA